jgi:uncharacterized OB-fold protein
MVLWFEFSGFQFSPDEVTALVQKEGGPCAVIAPVQAFLLRALIKSNEPGEVNLWRNVSRRGRKSFEGISNAGVPIRCALLFTVTCGTCGRVFVPSFDGNPSSSLYLR